MAKRFMTSVEVDGEKLRNAIYQFYGTDKRGTLTRCSLESGLSHNYIGNSTQVNADKKHRTFNALYLKSVCDHIGREPAEFIWKDKADEEVKELEELEETISSSDDEKWEEFKTLYKERTEVLLDISRQIGRLCQEWHGKQD